MPTLSFTLSIRRPMRADLCPHPVCEAVRTLWAGGVIDSALVPDLFQRAKKKEFFRIVHKDDSLFGVTFLVDEKYRGLTIRVVPEANVLPMVVMHNTSELDGCKPTDTTSEAWAEECLNADGVANWPPYGADDYKRCGFSGIDRMTRSELVDWRTRETFGPPGARYVMYEVRESTVGAILQFLS